MRREKAYSPIPDKRFGEIMKHLKDGEYATVHRRNDRQGEEFHAQPIGPQPRPQQVGHPFLRNLGLVGLGAGLGALGYRYHEPILKLGQKVINYTTDKFHHLFNPPNNTTTQINNRAAF